MLRTSPIDRVTWVMLQWIIMKQWKVKSGIHG